MLKGDQQEADRQQQTYSENVETERKLQANKQVLLHKFNTLQQAKDLILTYVRYADDWIILTNGQKDIANQIKDACRDFLSNELNLTLSEEKTKITNITESCAFFLGYTIFRKAYKRTRRIDITSQKKAASAQKAVITAGKLVRGQLRTVDLDPKTPNRAVYRTAAASAKLRIGIDQNRIIKRWILNKIITHLSYKPREMPAYSILPIEEIITHFNQRMLGLAQYYYNTITEKYRLNFYLYILYYSCLKTLATKLKLSINQITEKYGYFDVSPLKPTHYNKKANTHQRLRIVYHYQFMNKHNQLTPKFVVLYNYRT